jgi:hypothetical protein
MSILDHTAHADSRRALAETATETPTRWAKAVPVAAATALVAGPVLFALGMATSPQAASTDKADYIASLSRDLTQTQVSALLLHYGNLLMGLGILGAPSLVRGRRGQALTAVGALAAALGFTNLSGTLMSDWWNAATGLLAPDRAPAILEHVLGAGLGQLWFGTQPLSLLGPVLVLVGLARAGVVGWWTLPVLVVGIVGFIALSNGTPVVAAAAILAGLSPLVLIGIRLVRRSRLVTAA